MANSKAQFKSHSTMIFRITIPGLLGHYELLKAINGNLIDSHQISCIIRTD